MLYPCDRTPMSVTTVPGWKVWARHTTTSNGSQVPGMKAAPHMATPFIQSVTERLCAASAPGLHATLRTERSSPPLQARLWYTATVSGSYEATAGVARCWGSPVSDDLIHALVQRRGSEVADLAAATPPPPPRRFSLVIMMDGWMAR